MSWNEWTIPPKDRYFKIKMTTRKESMKFWKAMKREQRYREAETHFPRQSYPIFFIKKRSIESFRFLREILQNSKLAHTESFLQLTMILMQNLPQEEKKSSDGKACIEIPPELLASKSSALDSQQDKQSVCYWLLCWWAKIQTCQNILQQDK